MRIAGPAVVTWLALSSLLTSSIKSAEIRILLCGDLMLHKGVKRSASGRNITVNGRSFNNMGFDVPLAGLSQILSGCDIRFCNLEAPLVIPPPDDPYAMKTKGSFFFRAPPAVARAMAHVGFDVASIANNHIDNAGAAGLSSTAEILESAGIIPVGAGRNFDQAHRPALITRNGITVAFVAYCSTHLGDDVNVPDPGRPHVCRADTFSDKAPQLWKDLSAAARLADLVVLSFHWGPKEYQNEPDARIVDFAHLCAEHGADIIAGHHPHVLQRIEPYRCRDGRRCLIAYSLGNLVSNQSPRINLSSPDVDRIRRREGAALIVTVRSRKDNTRPSQPETSLPLAARARLLFSRASPGRTARANITHIEIVPLWTDNNYLRSKSRFELPLVRVVPVKDEILRLKKRIGFLEQRAKRIKGQLLSR